jgi:hypothetical protein
MRARLPRGTKNWFGPGGASRSLPRGLFVLLALLLTIGSTWACETPVYRYAMYRWQPTPYEIYSFHDDTNAAAHAAVEKAIADVSEGTDNRANVVFIPVNLTDDPELNGVTPDIKAAWQSKKDQSLPSYLISTPYGAQIYSGKLTADTIQALVESPARKRMAQHLEAGKIGVLLFLNGKDKKENEQAREILAELVKEVGEGKISLYTAPSDVAGGEEEAGATNPGLELGMIEINRDDEKETWLVRSLLAMESDLPDESRPMVFLAYGRGRALLPYIGLGINRENLLQEVEFISGACSCTVKEQNPGVDLLVRYDWEAASAALADRFGTEEGNEGQFGPSDFLPQLIIPSSSAPPIETVATADAAEANDATNVVEPEQTNDDVGDTVVTTTGDSPIDDGGISADETEEPNTADAASEDPATIADATPTTTEDATTEVATTEDATMDDAAGGNYGGLASVSEPSDFSTFQSATTPTYISMFVVGGGLALGLVILFGLTFYVMRPH